MGDVITFRPRPRPTYADRHREMVERSVALALDVVDGLIAILDQLDTPFEDLEPDNDREDGGDDEPFLVIPLRGS